ncbi:uncharacterized protein LOC132277006 isoform X2 [Cornus florida]|nr:uncharacterized protein LOC132277006 isoform X2 [Cornus florida]
MGVGWGYGANMLTKYLAEVGEKTPLTAATCIDNPFDLEEATKSATHYTSVDQKLMSGLIDILRSNKELFHGRGKGFDVEKALLAKSVRDFEREVSMVSYGFDAIEDFYAKSSTRVVVGNVKIPVLFIQTDEGTVPLFSIPHSLIAENPFTSLLLCSCFPSTVIGSDRFTISWCQHLTIEWLTAVELGLLKGRHPLLKDVDVTINPSKGFALAEGRASNKSDTINRLLNLRQSDALNGYSVVPSKEMLEGSDITTSIPSRFKRDLQINFKLEKGLRQENNSAVQQTSSVDAELVKEGVGPMDSVDSETGKVLQTTQVVMNVLDVTMPGTLSEEQKKKVLTAVGQGETLMTALQDAVPEDVRGKLTSAVSGILHNQGTNLNFDKLLNVSQIPNMASALNPKFQEQGGGLSNTEGGHEDPHSSEQQERVNDLADDSNKNQPNTDKCAGGVGPELQASENLQESIDKDQFQSTGSHSSDISDSVKKDDNEFDNNQVVIENTIQPGEENITDSSYEQNKTISSTKEEGNSSPVSSPETELTEREGSDNQKREEKTLQPVVNQDSPDSPTFGVSEALDALTGMDDSTQVAVNSVFGVIENMITQLEEKEKEIEVKDGNEIKDQKTVFPSENNLIIGDEKLEEREENNDDMILPSDKLDAPPCNIMDLQNHARTRWVEGKPIKHPISFDRSIIDSSRGSDTASHIGEQKNEMKEHLGGQKLLAKRYFNDIKPYMITNPFGDACYKEYLRKYLLSNMASTKPLDLDKTTALFLDYFPEEGLWKLLEQPGNSKIPIGDGATLEGVEIKVQAHSTSKANYTGEIIEPSYVILDAEKRQEPVAESEAVDELNQKVEVGDTSVELMSLVKKIILHSLNVEVGRKLSSGDMKEMVPDLARDFELIADAVSLAVGRGKERVLFLDGKDCTSEKVGTLNGEHIIKAISIAVQETSYLRRLLPVGVIVGSCLAALRKFFIVATVNGNGQHEALVLDQVNSGERNRVHHEIEINQFPSDKIDHNYDLQNSEEAESKNLNNDAVMVSAVSAALGASALLVHQQDARKGSETAETLSVSFKKESYPEPDKLEVEMSEKSQNNLVTSLAEKAMSVAGPVVPTTEDGEVDQERLVAMLAEWGQKGGMLRLVGKVALLWGGFRGAMSLTDRLILFLRLAERPLFQRILGFVCMVLVLWSPVVVPLLPTLVRNWATHTSSKIAELACIFGLYTSIMILVTLWGKRIRGYEDPLQQYGLDLTSLPKIQFFLKGLIGGVMLVLSIHSVNTLLGCVRVSWPSTLPSSSLDAVTWIKVYGRMLILVGQGLITATGVALVEELLFRSWLPDEIAADLGYYRGIIISGFVFSLFQRSPWAIPGLWLLSLGLAGARQRSQGSLSLPIGLRAGIMASSFVLQHGGFLTSQPNFPRWVTGTHAFQPFSGVAGIALSLLLAIVLYPREPLHEKPKNKDHSGIRDYTIR